MKASKLLLGISLAGLLNISNPVFSQYFESARPSIDISRRFKPGAELGAIINKHTRGISFGLYYSNNRLQIGTVAETNIKYGLSFLDDGIDLFKCGFGVEYFPTNFERIRPYIGSEVKYEHESLFISRTNKNYNKQGMGLELKIGSDFKPLKNINLKLFLDLGYNFSLFDKKLKGYPEDTKIKRDKFITVAGIKF